MRNIHRAAPFLPLLTLALLVACGGGEATPPAQAETVEATAPQPEPTRAKTSQPKVISQGERVELAAHADPGRTTVFDFTSEYCPPCRQIAPYLDKLHGARDDVAVVKVDINRPGQRRIDWGSPVAKQFGLTSIPHFKVFDGEGTLLAEGRPAWDMVVGWINEVMQAERAEAGSM